MFPWIMLIGSPPILICWFRKFSQKQKKNLAKQIQNNLLVHQPATRSGQFMPKTHR